MKLSFWGYAPASMSPSCGSCIFANLTLFPLLIKKVTNMFNRVFLGASLRRLGRLLRVPGCMASLCYNFWFLFCKRKGPTVAC